MTLECTRTVFDPLFDEIPVTELEVKVLLAPPLQRARNIKQLGTAAFLKNAPHTRLMHSLGVMFLVDAALMRVLDGSVPNMEVGGHSLTGDQVHQCFRLAGLLHDIGHGPMSHVFEDYVSRSTPDEWELLWSELGFPDSYAKKPADLRSRSPKHEDVSWLMIADERFHLAGLLSAASIPPEVVAELAQGRFDNPIYRSLGGLVSGSLDMDRLDYSLRDTYYLGRAGQAVGYAGSLDWARLIDAYTLVKEGDSYQLAVLDELREIVDQFFALRSRFQTTVSQNLEVRVADLHLIHALRAQKRKAQQLVEDTVSVMTEWSDQELASVLFQAAPDTMARIVTGPDTFGVYVAPRLEDYPVTTQYRLLCQAYDRTYKLEQELSKRMYGSYGKTAGIKPGECRVYVGVNYPTEMPRVTLSRKVDRPTVGKSERVAVQYYQYSAYARAFTKDAYQKARLTAVCPALDDEAARGVLAGLLEVDRTSERKTAVWELLDKVRPVGFLPKRRSFRLDLVLVAIHALMDDAVSALCDSLGGPFRTSVGLAAADGLWIRGVHGLGGYVSRVQDLAPMSYPYAFHQQHSADLSSDLLLLQHTGMLRHHQMRIPRSLSPFGLRLDIQLSHPARHYVHELLSQHTEWAQTHEQIRDWLSGCQTKRLSKDRLFVGFCFNKTMCGDDCPTKAPGVLGCDLVITSDAFTDL